MMTGRLCIVLMLVAALAVLATGLTGCAHHHDQHDGDHPGSGEHPSAEQPAGHEHPGGGEHPSHSEHPK